MCVARSRIVSTLDYGSVLVEFSPEITPDSEVHRLKISHSYLHYITMHFLNSVSYVEITGTRYKQGNILVCSFDEEIPVFGKIVDIIVTKFSDCLFISIPYIGINFHTHYNAFEVYADTTHYIVYRQKDLKDYHPLPLSKSLLCSFTKGIHILFA